MTENRLIRIVLLVIAAILAFLGATGFVKGDFNLLFAAVGFYFLAEIFRPS